MEEKLRQLTKAELLEVTLGLVSQLNEQQLQTFSSSLNGYLAKKTATEKKQRNDDHPFEMAKYPHRDIICRNLCPGIGKDISLFIYSMMVRSILGSRGAMTERQWNPICSPPSRS
jgi:hypothetical protein